MPFNNLSDDSFLETSENGISLLDRSRIDNIVFSPYQRDLLEVQENINDRDIVPNSTSHFYTSPEFNSLVANRQLTENKLSFLHLNIRSMRNKFDALLNYLHLLAHKFSIIALTETWLNDMDGDNFKIPGYNLTKVNRQDKGGGGICIFTRDYIKIKLRNDLVNEENNSNTEFLFIEILNEKCKNIIVGIMYRPPSSNFNGFKNDINTILTKLDKSDKPCYIMGDFNIDLLKYECCNFSNIFFNQLSSSGFMPLITKPTRITKSTATLIDNIFTNNANKTGHQSGILLNDISDHLPIFTITELETKNCAVKPNSGSSYTTRKIGKKCLELFAEKIKNCDWQSTLSKSNPTESYESFFKEFFEIYDNFFPIKKYKSKNIKRYNNLWISRGLIKSSKTKEKLYKKFIKSPSINNEQNYKKYRNKLNHLIRIAKKNYYCKKFSQAQNDIKSTWNTINQLLDKQRLKSTLPRLFLNDENEEINDPNLIADGFNDYFVNVGPKLAEKLSHDTDKFYKYLEGNYKDSIFLYDTSPEEVNRIIDKLECKSSCGIDEIRSKVIKYVAPYVSVPLTHIFNLTFSTGIIPNDLKVALITPVYKASEKNVFSNYRPISVLPFFSKILEKLMYKRLTDYINKNGILTDRQYGFRSKSSTNHAIIELVDKITKAIENNEFTVGIFLDLSKAFDTVNHNILLKKLYFYGIRGKCHAWIKDYLSNRKQIVKYNNIRSTEKIITCGVPQGSILGPLLFLIYINDLNNSTSKLSTILFADDTNLFCSGKDLEELELLINEELARVQEWLMLNKLTLNVKKSNFVIFKSHKRKLKKHMSLKLNNEMLQWVEHTKFLGIIIDQHLTWKNHINYVTKKIIRTTGVLCRIRFYISQPLLRMLYYSLIYPHLYYGNIVWANTYPTRLEKLFKLQKKILRIITFSSYTAPSLQLFRKLNLLNIHQINDLLIASFSFSLYSKVLPPYFEDFCIENFKVHSYNTRGSKQLHKTFNRTNYGKYSTREKIVNIWNEIPKTIKCSASLKIFKTKMKQFFLQN